MDIDGEGKALQEGDDGPLGQLGLQFSLEGKTQNPAVWALLYISSFLLFLGLVAALAS